MFFLVELTIPDIDVNVVKHGEIYSVLLQKHRTKIMLSHFTANLVPSYVSTLLCTAYYDNDHSLT